MSAETPPVAEMSGLDEQFAAFELAAAEEPGAQADGVEPQFATVEAFVSEFVIPFYIRDTTNARWCRCWWDHREAASRLEALWEAYEAARASTDGGAFSAWWRLDADHHLPLLMSAEGPFRNCSARQDTHTAQHPQPLTAAPAGMFVPDPPSPPTSTHRTD